jgi:predicted molibdopterin-dependent oxidoreductase YjgC
MIRQQNGSFSVATWEKSIEYVVEALKNIIKRYGPSSVGLLSSARCTNEENYLMVKLARAVLKTPNIDHCARL